MDDAVKKMADDLKLHYNKERDCFYAPPPAGAPELDPIPANFGGEDTVAEIAERFGAVNEILACPSLIERLHLVQRQLAERVSVADRLQTAKLKILDVAGNEAAAAREALRRLKQLEKEVSHFLALITVGKAAESAVLHRIIDNPDGTD